MAKYLISLSVLSLVLGTIFMLLSPFEKNANQMLAAIHTIKFYGVAIAFAISGAAWKYVFDAPQKNEETKA